MIRYRRANLAELRQILDWAAEEGWNPGLDDAEPFFAADPEGFFIATDEETPVAGISVVNHSADFAFLGLYIVRPAYRGSGIGLALWNVALEHAGTRVIGLDGVPAQQANYAASGFDLAGANTRYQGQIVPRSDAGVQCAGTRDIARLIGLEAQACGYAKPAYLKAWFEDGPNRTTLTLGTAGFATVRRCRAGAKIGPLLAETPEAAEILIRHAASLCPGDITIDVPRTATALSELCQALGLQPGFETARMYRGRFAHTPPSIYAVASLELG